MTEVEDAVDMSRYGRMVDASCCFEEPAYAFHLFTVKDKAVSALKKATMQSSRNLNMISTADVSYRCCSYRYTAYMYLYRV